MTRGKSSSIREDKIGRARAEEGLFPVRGGKHLCSRRFFAFIEILGILAALFLGFNVVPKDGSFLQVPGMRSKVGEAVTRPTEETMSMGAKTKRREGWEDVLWKFKTDEE